jgi:excisionase family DNA binding protein
VENLVSVEDAALRLGLQPATVRLWLAQGKIATVKLGRRRLILPGEIERLIRQNTIPALVAGGE